MNKRFFKKKLYALCAAAGMLSAVLFPCAGEGALLPAAELVGKTKKTLSASDFADVSDGAWYYDYVDALVRSGTVVGTSESTFSPADRFTVAEAATVITRYLGLSSYAANRKNECAASVSALWYGSYMQTLVDAGVMTNGEYGLSVAGDGLITALSSEDCMRPIKRYEFASLITRSFDIRTDRVRARHIPSELSPNGNSFIVGGRYDATVSRYAEKINDYEKIPESAREEVLKAYYNGIFNGDENGNFNPDDPLLRCEMAKAVSVILDFSLRNRIEYREMFAVYGEIGSHLIVDGWREKALDRNFSYTLLSANASLLAVASSGVYNSIAYTPIASPAGYLTEIWVYESKGGTYTQIARRLSTESEPITADGENLRVLFVLRNSDSAKVEGVLQVDIAKDGTVTRDDRFKSVL